MKHFRIYFFLFALLMFVGSFARWWMLEMKDIAAQPINSWTETPQAECAIVLTGGPNRINEGMDLLYQGLIKKLIVSGVNPDSHLEEIYPNIVFYGSIEKENIILEKNSKTTYGNAQQSLPLVEALNCHDILLITSRLHMYRAYKTFRAHFPASINIYARATIGKETKANGAAYQLTMESLKSMFYSLWAY